MLAALLPNSTGQPIPASATDVVGDRIRAEADPADLRIVRCEDARPALAVFLRVCGATVPPILPFLFASDLFPAMRLSNAVAVGMLFRIGWRLDREIGQGTRDMRRVVPVAGAVLVLVTIAPGG